MLQTGRSGFRGIVPMADNPLGTSRPTLEHLHIYRCLMM